MATISPAKAEHKDHVMTPEQQEQFTEMAQQTKEVHDFLFKPPTEDQPTRAKQLDRMFTVNRGYKFSGKLAMAAMGFFLTVGSIIISFETLKARLGGGP